MEGILVSRIVHVIFVLIIVSFGITFLMNLIPGNPAYTILGDQATQQQVVAVDKALNLNQPFFERYWHWVIALLHGDFGVSFITHQSVIQAVGQAAPVTAELIVVAFIMALVVSIPAGVYCGYRPDGRFDRIWFTLTSIFISSPVFVSALLLVFAFGVELNGFPIHFPVTGWTAITAGLGSNLWHAFLPSLTLALPLISTFSRLLRADMVATLQEDYILAARARGIPVRRILVVHALRQSSLSLFTLAGIQIGQLISGAAIAEVVFALPGLGQLFVNASSTKDIPTVQGEVLFIALAYVLLNTIVDFAYSHLDPRIRSRVAGVRAR